MLSIIGPGSSPAMVASWKVFRTKPVRWQVIDNVDGHKSAAIASAIEAAVADRDRPSLICCKTVIGFGSPNKQGTASTHGAPLGDEEIAATRVELGWNYPPFEIPEDVSAAWNGLERGKSLEQAWQEIYDGYAASHPELAAELSRRMQGELPDTWADFADKAIAGVNEAGADMATRKASLVALNAFAPALPEMAGGSADLTGSNLTRHDGSTTINGDDASGNYIYFGVREFGMSALCNGLGLHGGIIPYSGTFLTFSDYSRNALRMAAGLGEDGPTHQPVEHTASLRIMPNMSVWRPCDGVETAIAWRTALERRDGPTSLILTRQGLPHQARNSEQIDAIYHGGYVLRDSDGTPDIIMIATGSEVALVTAAAAELDADGIKVRVVSMPSTDQFDAQSDEYRESVLPAGVTSRVAVEAGVTEGWWRYVGTQGRVIGLDRFGASAPAEELFEHFGFTVANVLKIARETLA
jgi:transketolase